MIFRIKTPKHTLLINIAVFICTLETESCLSLAQTRYLDLTDCSQHIVPYRFGKLLRAYSARAGL